jgi:hypothetical protein
MLYAMKIGPLATTEGFMFAFVATTPAGISEPVMAKNDNQGLKELLALHPGVGKDQLTCEKALFKAGKPLGFTLARPDQQAIYARASIAMLLALGGTIDIRDPRLLAVINAFCGCSAAFHRSKPWDQFDERTVFHVICEGALNGVYEAVVLRDIDNGLILYEEPGTALKVADQNDAEEYDEAAVDHDYISFNYDETPEYAAEALKAAVNLPLVPRPMRWKDGHEVPTTALELLLLVHVSSAIMDLMRGGESQKLATEALAIDGDHAPPPLRVRVSREPFPVN